MSSRDDFKHPILVFGIPIDPEYRELARIAWRDVKTWVEHGPKELAPEDRARTELVQILADQLRRDGIPHPLREAWNRVGTPNAKKFAEKLEPGQPLGDLTQQAVLDQFKPLILSRLKHFRVAGNEDAKSAAQVGLLHALASYNPAEDVSVGYYAKIYRHIDDAIKYEIRGKESDAWYRPKVSGDEHDEQLGYDEDGEGYSRWDTIAKAVLPDRTATIIDGAYDDQGRLRANRLAGPYRSEYPIVFSFPKASIIIPRKTAFATALWITDANPPWKKQFVAKQPWPMPPAPRQLPWRPPGPPDFRHRRILEDIRQWPLLDACTQTVHGTRVTPKPDNFFDSAESYLAQKDI
jgi:hypothetical protein